MYRPTSWGGARSELSGPWTIPCRHSPIPKTTIASAINANADVAFSVQPPSGKFDVVETDSVFVGEDAAGGGTDLDASRTYSLSPVLGGYAVNPQQGFHIKVEVNAPFSNGADKKSKVFWVQSCVSSGGGES